MRVAVAVGEEDKIFPGHFAHAKRFKIFDYSIEDGESRFVEDRKNKLGELPDMDDPDAIHRFVRELGVPLHGIPKYMWLKENVLSDVDVIVAGGACQTSYSYFMSEGVVVIFEEPNGDIEGVFNLLREVLK